MCDRKEFLVLYVHRFSQNGCRSLDLKIKKATFPSYPGKNGCAFKIIINSSAEERSINN